MVTLLWMALGTVNQMTAPVAVAEEQETITWKQFSSTVELTWSVLRWKIWSLANAWMSVVSILYKPSEILMQNSKTQVLISDYLNPPHNLMMIIVSPCPFISHSDTEWNSVCAMAQGSHTMAPMGRAMGALPKASMSWLRFEPQYLGHTGRTPYH